MGWQALDLKGRRARLYFRGGTSLARAGSARSRALGKGKVIVSPVGGLEARVLWLLCLEHGLEDVEGFREEQGADCSCDS